MHKFTAHTKNKTISDFNLICCLFEE